MDRGIQLEPTHTHEVGRNECVGVWERVEGERRKRDREREEDVVDRDRQENSTIGRET
jgi:hypothetical protein